MADFVPVNSLELRLRATLQDKNTPSWSFYTPLGAAPLWIFVQHHPELDGSDLIAPEGQNPGFCVFTGPTDSYIGLYTAESRATEAFEKLKLNPYELTITSAQGYELFRFLASEEAGLLINLGLPECQYYLDRDMIEILLTRPQPSKEPAQPTEVLKLTSTQKPERHLGPLRDFLATQPTVRAAWILPYGEGYQVGLVMRDPDDKSLLEKVCTIAKALTPVEIEWVSSNLMGEDKELRKLAKKKFPFYEAPDFLKRSRRSH